MSNAPYSQRDTQDIADALRECARAQDEDEGRFDTRPTSELLREAAEALEQQAGPEDAGTSKDIARLDWLEQQSTHGLIVDLVADWTYNGRRYATGMRDAIDAAMSDATDRDGGTDGK